MQLLDVLKISVCVSTDADRRNNNTYGEFGGFLTYQNGDHLYVIKSYPIIKKYLEELGFVPGDQIPKYSFSSEDLNRMLIGLARESVEEEELKKLPEDERERILEKRKRENLPRYSWEDVRLLSTYLLDQDFHPKMEKMNSIYKLAIAFQPNGFIRNHPGVGDRNDDFFKTEVGRTVLIQYQQLIATIREKMADVYRQAEEKPIDSEALNEMLDEYQTSHVEVPQDIRRPYVQ